MRQNYTWLATSLFCGKSSWKHVIEKGITPFLSDPVNKIYQNSFLLEFNYLSGENIRFSPLVKEEDTIDVSEKLDSWFKNFFSLADLPQKRHKLPVKGLFMPFPSNSIQYGLYDPIKIMGQEDYAEYKFRKGLSMIMIDALKDEAIDDETILTFVFYLTVAWLKVIMITWPDVDKNLSQLYIRHEIHNGKKVDKDFISQNFEHNKEMLLEITSDIMAYSFTKPVNIPSWLESWMQLCENEISKEKALHNSKESVKIIYRKTLSVVFQHLGITVNMRSILLYFIDRVFTDQGNT